MIKRVIKKIERLSTSRAKLIEEQSKIQKQIDDIDIEIKNYTTIKKEYEKLEKKLDTLINTKEEKKDG